MNLERVTWMLNALALAFEFEILGFGTLKLRAFDSVNSKGG
jgi:hypothetical protein